MMRDVPNYDLRAYAFQVIPLGITVVTYLRRQTSRSVPSVRLAGEQVAADREQVM
jgi:hypothetical protein